MKKTVGDLLREARNKKGLALQTIERSTGVATHHLLAIELDQFSLIEPEQFDACLRAYAEAVDLNYDDLRQDCDIQTAEAFEEPAPKPVTSFDDLVAETQPEYVPQPLPSRSARRYSRSERNQHASPRTAKKSKKKSILPLVILGLLGLAALSYGGLKLYEIYGNSNKQVAPASEKKVAESTSASTTEASSAAESTPEVTGPELTVTGGGEAVEVLVAGANTPLKVEISVAGEGVSSWVALTNSDLGEGGTTLSPEQPSYTATMIDGATEGLLTLGVTQGVTVKIDGKELDLSAVTSAATSFITIKIQ